MGTATGQPDVVDAAGLWPLWDGALCPRDTSGLLSLPAHHIPQACRDPAAPAEPLPVPQVTDKLQEMLTTSCSLKTTIEAFQEELQLLKDNFQKVRARSWAGAGGPSAEGL